MSVAFAGPEALSIMTTVKHLVTSLRKCTAYDEPYSHLYAEECFPADLYAAMLSNLPDPKLYHPLNHRDNIQADGTSTRGYLTLAERNDLPRLPGDQRVLWTAVADALGASDVKRAIFSHLRKDLTARFRVPETEVYNIETDLQIDLLRDVSGYAIKVHPDSSKRVVTAQFYLPADLSQRDLGTSIYRQERTGLLRSLCYGLFQAYRLLPPVRCRSLKNWLFDLAVSQLRFTKVRTHEFRPNSVGAFAVSGKSWHGRERLSQSSGVRNSILLMYLLPHA
jgi:hypothetical protein